MLMRVFIGVVAAADGVCSSVLAFAVVILHCGNARTCIAGVSVLMPAWVKHLLVRSDDAQEPHTCCLGMKQARHCTQVRLLLTWLLFVLGIMCIDVVLCITL